MSIEVDYLAQRPVTKAEFDLSFQREDGAYVGGPSSLSSDSKSAVAAGPGTVRCRIDTLPLPPAVYHISASVYDAGDQSVFDHRERLVTFRVVDATVSGNSELLRIPATWESVARPAEPPAEALAAADSGTASLDAKEGSSRTRT